MSNADDRPAETDAATARALFKALTSRTTRRKLSLTVQDREVPIPAAVVPALIEAARLVSEGHAVDPSMKRSAPRKPHTSSKYRVPIF